MNILVTGSNGMIGTRLCQVLLEKKYNVYGIDITENKYSALVNKITRTVNLLNASEVNSKLPKEIDYIIHLAAHSRVMETIRNPGQMIENIIMLKNVLDFSLSHKTKGIIFSSSREVYGNTRTKLCKESQLRCPLENPYAASKLACEGLLEAYSSSYGLKYVTLRFSNVYGMYDEGERVIPLFMKQAQRNEQITIFGKNKILDFTYIDDVVNGIILTLNNFSKLEKLSINIASGKGVKLDKLAKNIAIVLKKETHIVIKENRIGEVDRFVADISKAKRLIGFRPQFSLKDGLEISLSWYKKIHNKNGAE